MNDVKVSVIIPIYNVEEYLEEGLMSVVHQTLDGIQAIMIDDGSLDRSSDIAKDFADRYDNFEYIRQVNGGLGNARNTGIQYAKGKYIIFLDSDDIVPDDAYQRETTVIWWLDMYLDLIPKKKEYQIYMNLPFKNI